MPVDSVFADRATSAGLSPMARVLPVRSVAVDGMRCDAARVARRSLSILSIEVIVHAEAEDMVVDREYAARRLRGGRRLEGIERAGEGIGDLAEIDIEVLGLH